MKTKSFILIVLFPIIISAQCLEQVATIDRHVVVLKNDGTIWAFGSNSAGQIGDGTTINRYSPVPVGLNNDWMQIFAGKYSTKAIKSDGTLWRWGAIDTEQLIPSVPTQFGTDHWLTVSQAYYHTLGIKQDGTLWAWGNNWNGYPFGLGTSDPPNSDIPVQVGSENTWESVSTGENTSYAIKLDGSLWVWGANYYGQLGLGFTNVGIDIPVRLGTEYWKNVYAGPGFALAIKDDGSLWGWGQNDYFTLGDGSNVNKISPVLINSDSWKMIGCSQHKTIGIKDDGTLWTWGGTWSGTNYFPFSYIPVQVGSSNNWKTAQAGVNNYAAIENDGTMWVWGKNGDGQLGDGTQVDNFIPTILSCTSLGINEIADNMPIVYPNPFENQIYINSKSGIQSIQIYDTTGRIVVESYFDGDYTVDMDMSKITAAGVYTLKILNNDTTTISKIIKQ